MASTVTAMPSTRMSEAEWQTRLDLAACYRLVDLFGWSDLVNTRITARVPGQHDHFLINPYGLLFDEVTASSLVKIDAEGNKVEPSESEVNSGGFAIPSTIHMARPEVACVLHTHSIAGCAVSMQRDGLLPLNQHALQIIGDIAYHDYEGVGRNPEERARLLADLGHRHILVLRNHGLLIVGDKHRCGLCRHLSHGAGVRDAAGLPAIGRRVPPHHRRGRQRRSATTVLDWRKRLVCSNCGSRQIDMVVTGQRR